MDINNIKVNDVPSEIGVKILIETLARIPLNKPRIIDLGCGDGHLTSIVANFLKAKEVCGIDIQDRLLEKAKMRGIVTYKVDLNWEKLPFKDNYFDLALASEIIEHLLNPDNLLEESYRILKPGGYFIIKTPNLSSWMNRIYMLLGYQPPDMETSTKIRVGNPWRRNEPLSGHIRPFTARAIRELLEYHKYVVLKVRGFPHNKRSLPKIIYPVDKLLAKRYTLAHWIVVLSKKNRRHYLCLVGVL
jgi:methionine biosynthesis protein MetW